MEANLNTRHGLILIADDDLDYHLIVKCVLEEVGFKGTLLGVSDGTELRDFLLGRGKHKCAMTPDLIILDIDMQGQEGRSALREIKEDPGLRHIPVAVLTTSISEEDKDLCGRFRKCSYMRKPETYKEWGRCLEEILRDHLPYWGPADATPDKECK